METRYTRGAALVAPHAGAWIETCAAKTRLVGGAVSHPTRVRGLKLPIIRDIVRNSRVAPHAGAWIETCPRAPDYLGSPVAPHAGAWIETSEILVRILGEQCRTPRGCVD